MLLKSLECFLIIYLLNIYTIWCIMYLNITAKKLTLMFVKFVSPTLKRWIGTEKVLIK
jgi:hypothetical protein